MHSRRLEAPAVIVGGGIAGCATAYYLARRGLKPVLLERLDVGTEASGRNAGGVRAQCRQGPDRPLAMASIELWQTLGEELGADLEYRQGGNIRLAATEERMAELEQEADAEWQDGLQVELWDADRLYDHAPYLAETFIGAKYCPIDGVANPRKVTPALAAEAARLGADIRTHTEVLSVLAEDNRVIGVVAQQDGTLGGGGELVFETPLVIHAAGPWSPQLGADLGIQLPIVPSRTIIGRTEPAGLHFTEFLSAHDVGVCCRPDVQGRIHISAAGDRTPDFTDYTNEQILAYLQENGPAMVPALAGLAYEEVWSGILAMTPDKLPIYGEVEGLDGYLLATGFSGHGFCLGPISGKLLSELVLDGEPSLDLSAFRLSRF